MPTLSDYLARFADDNGDDPFAWGRIQGLRFIAASEPGVQGPILLVTASIPDQTDWTLRLTFDVSTDELMLTSVTVEPTDGVALQQLPATVLRDLRTAEITEQIHSVVRTQRGYKTPSGAAAWLLAKDFHKTERPGRRGRSDIHYAQVAELYVNLLGEPAPVKVLATKLRVKEQAARDLLRQARRRGLLTPPDQGRAGGALTARAQELLDGQH